MNGQLHCETTHWADERTRGRNGEYDADASVADWLLDQPVPRARDLRYRPDDLPANDESALVDLVLGVESAPIGRVRHDDRRDEAIRTHWTMILSHDLEANDDASTGANRRDAWKIVGKATVALTAAYVFVYLLVVAVVYLARVPDATSVLLPASPPAPAHSDILIETPDATRAS